MKALTIKTIDYIIDHPFPKKSIGLLSGKMGICILIYHAYKETSNIKYKKIADNLLDEVYENLNPNLLSFESGIVGIGWAIEYLAQANFVSGNTDKILAEIDDTLFRFIQTNNSNSISLTDGLSGFLLYIVSRLQSRENKKDEKRLIKEDLLRQIIDELNDKTFSSFEFINHDLNIDFLNAFPGTIYALKKALDLNIYNNKIIIIINQWVNIINTIIPSMHTHRFLIAMALKYINNSIRSKEIDNRIFFLLNSINYEIMCKEMNPYSYNIQDGWGGFILMLKIGSKLLKHEISDVNLLEHVRKRILLQHTSLFQEYLDLLKEPSKNIIHPVINLRNGLGGIALLNILYPEAFIVNKS